MDDRAILAFKIVFGEPNSRTFDQEIVWSSLKRSSYSGADVGCDDKNGRLDVNKLLVRTGMKAFFETKIENIVNSKKKLNIT